MTTSFVAHVSVFSGMDHLVGTNHCKTNDYYPERLKASDGCAGCQGMSAAVDSLIKQLAYLLK